MAFSNNTCLVFFFATVGIYNNLQTFFSACSILARGYSGKSNLQLPSSATVLQDDKHATVVLLGTVHFSKQSVQDVSTVRGYIASAKFAKPITSEAWSSYDTNDVIAVSE